MRVWIRVDVCVCTSARANGVDRLLSEPSEVGLGLVRPIPSSGHSPIHLHFLLLSHPLSSTSRFPVAARHTLYLWPVAKYRNNQPCPLAAIIRTNGSSLPHNPSSSNNTVVSQSHPISPLVEPHVLPTSIKLRASKYRHVGCREKQSSQRRRRPAPETTQCLDPLSLRQAPRTAPTPRWPPETDTGGGVQDHLGAMARRDGRCARDVRAAR